MKLEIETTKDNRLHIWLDGISIDGTAKAQYGARSEGKGMEHVPYGTIGRLVMGRVADAIGPLIMEANHIASGSSVWTKASVQQLARMIELLESDSPYFTRMLKADALDKW